MTLLNEIGDQPAVFAKMLDSGRASIRAIAAETAGRFEYVAIAARGTSDNAARYAKYLWAINNGHEVSLAAPSLFSTYMRPPRLDGALVVGISQSGESPDLVAVLQEAQRQGRPTLAITNEPNSPLAQAGDWVLDIEAGEERSVAATKTFTAQLLAVALLSTEWAGAQNEQGLDELPGNAEQVLRTAEHVAGVAAAFADDHACAVLGRGLNRATSFEWALKLQEMTYTLAHPYSTADFRHGPIAVVESGFPTLAVAPSGAVSNEIMDLLDDLREQRGAKTALISNVADAGERADHLLSIPDCPEWLSPLTAIVAGQLFSYHLAVARGVDPDAPRGLSKVTRTV